MDAASSVGNMAREGVEEKTSLTQSTNARPARAGVCCLGNLLDTLRNRGLAQAAKDTATETGLEPRPVADGQRLAGIYRRSVMLASRRYARLHDGLGFSSVPCRPVIEQRFGQQIAATVRGGGVSWEVGRQRGPSMS